ncbi:MAG: hypothetical protein R2877_04460 [Bdellovibrionota bacterium]
MKKWAALPCTDRRCPDIYVPPEFAEFVETFARIAGKGYFSHYFLLKVVPWGLKMHSKQPWIGKF